MHDLVEGFILNITVRKPYNTERDIIVTFSKPTSTIVKADEQSHARPTQQCLDQDLGRNPE